MYEYGLHAGLHTDGIIPPVGCDKVSKLLGAIGSGAQFDAKVDAWHARLKFGVFFN